MNEGQKFSTKRLAELEKYKKNKKAVNAEKKKFNAELNAKKREIAGTSQPNPAGYKYLTT